MCVLILLRSENKVFISESNQKKVYLFGETPFLANKIKIIKINIIISAYQRRKNIEKIYFAERFKFKWQTKVIVSISILQQIG